MDGNLERDQVEGIAGEKEENLFVLRWHEEICEYFSNLFCSTHAGCGICHEDHQSGRACHSNKLPKVSAREYFLCAVLRARTHHPSVRPSRQKSVGAGGSEEAVTQP